MNKKLIKIEYWIQKKFSNNPFLSLVLITVFIIVIWGASGTYLRYKFLALGTEHRGTFGDMFGVINSLFSGIALAGIIFTAFLQIIELRLQRKELSLTRKEFQKQSEEFNAQNRILSIQRFENSFFQMLTMHNQLVEKIEFQEKKGKMLFPSL